MHQQKISFKNSSVNYYKYGNGEKVLFCLHGYSEDGKSFSFLENHIGTTYTLYAIDLPFHGNTKWNEDQSLNAKDLIDLFNIINPNSNRRVSILAYSFGGRIALHLFEKFNEQFEKIVLVAPDGLHVNSWYWLSVHTLFGNRLFKANMQNPSLFFSLLKLADKAKLMNKSIVKFVHYYLDDKNERSLLYKRWTIMKAFKPNLTIIKKLCIEKNVDMHILFGKYDRFILSKHATVFNHVKNISIKTIDAGHRLLNENYVSDIVALLNS